ncbi:hypothetical protein LCGC14_1368030 [marine sediment metagenome]|uniref:PNPLA domain-containing protein n=1 Tax=marine sediment metagenome TaxID=412755 RepID=A0A0F9KS52_9ZZZZ
MAESKDNNIRKGLALSGGGFRASFFHIGVLAHLAEIGWLHDIDVISTVSGGSIVGALYYLHLKKLFESKHDTQIKPQDYIDVVDAVEKEFFAGVQENIRTKTFADLAGNRKMFQKNYSRSDRIGELYEEILYKSFMKSTQERIYMSDLKIKPEGFPESQDFKPLTDNGDRTNKVPILLLNATSLNTGHNWQFTATWMGEPPRGYGDIDKNMRLRRLYYREAPRERLENLPLGVAVAASAGVPGLFPPMAVSELYDDITVQLVDGGVHDNLGNEGLYHAGCNYIICSDASGQMDDDKDPGDGILPVLLRSNSILMDRVREATLVAKKSETSEKLKAFKYVHLKRGLLKPDITWSRGKDKDGQVQVKDTGGITGYGVDREVQRLLSNIRTDLDSFSEVEAYSLILSGYLMTEEEFNNDQTTGDKKCKFHNKPGLTTLKQLMEKPDQRYIRQLEVAGSRFLKAFKLVPWLKGVGLCAIVVLAAVIFWLLYPHLNSPVPGVEYLKTWKTLIVALVTAVITVFIRQIPGIRWIYYYRIVKNVFLQVWIASFGFLFARFHLSVVDPEFKKQGELTRLSQ